MSNTVQSAAWAQPAPTAQPVSPAGPSARVFLRVLVHLAVPMFLVAGMALAYLGGFHDPGPHGVRVDVAGSGVQAQALAQRIQDGAGGRVAVRTVPTSAAARQQIETEQVSAAYVPGAAGADGAAGAEAPQLLVTTAGSDTTAAAVEQMIAPVALDQGLPLHVVDVVPAGPHDPSGQGLFFYMIALTVGAYSAAVAIGAAGSMLPMRTRVVTGIAAGAAIAAIATAVAGPLYQALPGHATEIGLLAWLYTSAVVLAGVGLHTFLGRLTTAALVALFVMLNFTSSGGVYAPSMQPGFFGALHSFWIGSGLVEAGRKIMYFPRLGITGQVVILALWAAAGIVLTMVAAAVEQRRRRRPGPAGPPSAGERRAMELAAEGEIEEAVPA